MDHVLSIAPLDLAVIGVYTKQAMGKETKEKLGKSRDRAESSVGGKTWEREKVSGSKRAAESCKGAGKTFRFRLSQS